MKYRVCEVGEIPRGQKRSYTIKNVPIVITHSQSDEFYAIYARCL